jgi:DNA-binding NarL/FixJ family response regulator
MKQAKCELSDRQRSALLGVAQGKDHDTIGGEMGCTAAAVTELVDEARRKLGANTKPQAVYLATSWHIIPPAEIG